MTVVDWRLPENPSYKAVHLRLARHRGPARAHSCPCGKQAVHWAHIPGEGDLVDAEGRVYSADLSRYTAMCRSCHFSMDTRTSPRRAEAMAKARRSVTDEGRARGYEKLRQRTRSAEARANYRAAWTPERRAAQAEVARRVNAARKVGS